jgi:hypothetical protein
MNDIKNKIKNINLYISDSFDDGNILQLDIDYKRDECKFILYFE